MTYRQKLGKEDLLSRQKGRLRGDLIVVNNYLMGRCKPDRARLLEVHRDKMRGKRRKL